MVNIEEFKEKIKKGLAKPNRYNVNITFPLNSPLIGGNNNSQTLSILCESVDLPGSLLATNEDQQWGPFRKIPYINIYNDLSLTFMCDEDMFARTVFDTWQQNIINKSTFGISYYDDYISTVNIQLMSQNDPNDIIYEVNCFESYPIEVIAQQLAYENTDTYLKVEVRMAYRYWQDSENSSNSSNSFTF